MKKWNASDITLVSGYAHRVMRITISHITVRTVSQKELNKQMAFLKRHRALMAFILLIVSLVKVFCITYYYRANHTHLWALTIMAWILYNAVLYVIAYRLGQQYAKDLVR